MTKRKSESDVSESSQVETLAAAPAERKRETKKARFVRLANQRVPLALKRISFVRSLANRGSYAYTSEEADSIVDVLRQAVETVVRAFDEGSDEACGWKL